jgi:periplasmic protein TonB
MTLTYSEWTQAAEAPAPQAVFGLRPARDSRHLQQSARDRLLSLAVSAGGQILVAALILGASLSAIVPAPQMQTISVSISQASQPETPPPPMERLPDMPATMPQIAPPQLQIELPPAPMAIQAAPPSPSPPPQQEKVAEEAPVSPPRFDAAYLNNPAPVYPNMSRRLREVGTVQLRVRVSAAGLPLEIQLAKSSGYGRLDESALAAVQKYKFQPAMRGNTALEAWVLVPVEFSLTRS